MAYLFNVATVLPLPLTGEQAWMARLSAVLPAPPPVARTAAGMGQMAVSAEPERMTGFSEERRYGKKKRTSEMGRSWWLLLCQSLSLPFFQKTHQPLCPEWQLAIGQQALRICRHTQTHEERSSNPREEWTTLTTGRSPKGVAQEPVDQKMLNLTNCQRHANLDNILFNS